MNISWKRIGLMTSLLATTTAVSFVSPSWATEVYLDRQCQQTNNSRTKEVFRVDFRRNIQPGGQPYWFSLARQYNDGSGTAIFCLTRPNYTQGQLLAVRQLQNQLIREIKQENRETSFLITVAYGNGRQVPLTQFRLNLENPMQPKLNKLREWRE